MSNDKPPFPNNPPGIVAKSHFTTPPNWSRWLEARDFVAPPAQRFTAERLATLESDAWARLAALHIDGIDPTVGLDGRPPRFTVNSFPYSNVQLGYDELLSLIHWTKKALELEVENARLQKNSDTLDLLLSKLKEVGLKAED